MPSWPSLYPFAWRRSGALRCCALLACLGMAGCDSDGGGGPSGAGAGAGAGATSGGAGTGGIGAGGAGGGGAGTAGTLDDGGAERDASPGRDGEAAGADTGTDAPPPPVPVGPCDEALDAPVGEARPDFGAPGDGAAFTGDLANTGPFAVWKQDVTIPNPDAARAALDATFYAPSSDGGTSVTSGLHALVLVMHGFGTTHRNYEHFSLHLASHGFVALGLSLPFALSAAHDKNAAEALAAIDFALSSAAPGALAGRIDATKLAVAGHSFGGKIAFYAAALDSRISLVIGWDPSNAGGPPCFVDPNACNDFPVAPNCMADDAGLVHQLRAESLVLRAAPDGANPEPDHNAIHFFRGAPAPATLVDYDATVAHGDWANAGASVVPRSRRAHLALLLSRFYNRTGLEDFLPGGSMLGEGAVRVLQKP